jgi:PKHD-type hydroxylase
MVVQEGLARSQLFLSAALPKRIYPPLFNRYGVGEGFGDHVDNAIRLLPDGTQMRTDLSATLFLNDPEEYDDGELAIDSDFGRVAYKLRGGRYAALSLDQPAPCDRSDARRTHRQFLLD